MDAKEPGIYEPEVDGWDMQMDYVQEYFGERNQLTSAQQDELLRIEVKGESTDCPFCADGLVHAASRKNTQTQGFVRKALGLP
jgi:hypothetical protein